MPFPSPFDPGIAPARRTLWPLLLLVLLLLLQVLSPTGATRCLSERCSREFERTQYTLSVEERGSATPAYCRSLRRFTTCLRAIRTACIGDLYFHSNLRILEKKSNKLRCARVMKQAAAGTGPPPPPRPPPPQPDYEEQPTCSYHGSREPAFCGLFGDPHVRTFWGEYQTCRVQGAWPVIDNAYLAVQVTNKLAGSNDRATAPTKLTVIVKRNEPCTPQLTYEAQGDLLPAAFVDGSVTSGGGRSAHSVAVTAVTPGRHVRITLRHINTTLSVRRAAGGHLTLAVRLPKALADQSAAGRPGAAGLQLCARGCPAGERIDYQHVLAAGRPVNTVHAGRAATLTRDTIAQLCKQYGVTDFYFDACVFDVLFTGKTSFMESARQAQRDLRELMPQAVRSLPNRTELDLTAASGVAHADALVMLWTLWCAVVAPALVLR